MNKLIVRDYSQYAPVYIRRITSGAISANAEQMRKFIGRPVTGKAFDSERLMKAIIFGKDAKYFSV